MQETTRTLVTGSPRRSPEGSGLISRIIRAKYIYLALSIPFGLLVLFGYYPAASAFFHSFYEWNGVNYSKYVGFRNFINLFTNDPDFLPSTGRVLFLTACDVIKTVTVSLLVAYVIAHLRSARAKYVYRVLVIVPAVIPAMVFLLLWSKFFAVDGLINRVLEALGQRQWQQIWLGDTKWVLPGLVFMGFPWINGANTLIYLAGFLNIPRELYDAMSVDGASAWTRFWRLELPFLVGQIRLLVVLAIIGGVSNIGGLQSYEAILVLTQGGPANASMVPGLLLYNNAFRYNIMGYACAIGVVLFVIIMGLSVLNLQLTKTQTEYDAG